MSKINSVDISEIQKYKSRLFTQDHKKIQEGPLDKLVKYIDSGANISNLFDKNDIILLNSSLSCDARDINTAKQNITKLRLYIEQNHNLCNSTNAYIQQNHNLCNSTNAYIQQNHNLCNSTNAYIQQSNKSDTASNINNEVIKKYKCRLLNDERVQAGPLQHLVDAIKQGANIGNLTNEQINILNNGKTQAITAVSSECDKNFESNRQILLNKYAEEEAQNYIEGKKISLLKSNPLKKEVLDKLSDIAVNANNCFSGYFVNDISRHMLSIDYETGKSAAKLINNATKNNTTLNNSKHIDILKVLIDKIHTNSDKIIQQNLICALDNIINNGCGITRDAQVSLDKVKKYSKETHDLISTTINDAYKSYTNSIVNILSNDPNKQSRQNALKKLSDLNIAEYKRIIDVEKNSNDIEFIKHAVKKGAIITQSCFDTIEKNRDLSLDVITQILNDDKQVLPVSTIKVLSNNSNNNTLKLLDQAIRQGKSELPDNLLQTLIQEAQTKENAVYVIDSLLNKNKDSIKNIGSDAVDIIALSLNSNDEDIKNCGINVLNKIANNNKYINDNVCNTLAGLNYQTEDQLSKAANIIEKRNDNARRTNNISNNIASYNNSNNTYAKHIGNIPKYVDILETSRDRQEQEDAVKKLNKYLSNNKTLPNYAIDALHRTIALNFGNVATESLNALKNLSNYDKSKQLNIDEALKIQSQQLQPENIELDNYYNWVISQVSQIKDISNLAINAISSVLVNWEQETVENFLSRYSNNNVNDLLFVQELYGVNNDIILLALDSFEGANDVRSFVNNVYKILDAQEMSESEFDLDENTINKLINLGYLPEDLDDIRANTGDQFNQIINTIVGYNIPRESINYKDQNVIDIIAAKPQNLAFEISKLGSEVGFTGGAEKDLDALLAEIKQKNQDVNIEDLGKKYNTIMNHYNNGIKNLSAGDIQTKAKSVKDEMELIAIIKRANELSEKQELRAIQILSLILMIEGKQNTKGVLSQISTGEGKTTIVAMLAVINALKGQKVDVITSSPILASDGAKKKKNFYDLFGLSVGNNGSNEVGCYQKDIVYGSVDNFQYDFLRQEYMLKDTRHGREFGVVIADEVDSMLIDEGSKIAMLSENIAGMEYLESFLAAIFMCTNNFLQGFTGEEDKNGRLVFRESEENDDVLMVDDSIQFVKSEVIKVTEKEFFESDAKFKLPVNFIEFAKGQLANWVDMSILATRMKNKVDYIIKDNEIKPIDADNTGIVQTNMQWQNGLHQFLQIKHGLRISPESFTTCFISNVGYCQKYKKIFGLTGTLGSIESRNLLASTYGVDCKFIPTYKQKQFIELPALVIEDQSIWINNIVNNSKIEVNKGRGVLIICKSIQDVENIKNALQQSGIGNVKCYSDDTQDEGVDGKPIESGQVIVATNLAGRGTDIDAHNIEKYGGLHVCLTFLPNNQRVEDQAFGRTARQGQKGTGQLIIKGYVDINAIKANRDQREVERLAKIQNHELKEIATKDNLFLEKFMPYIASLRRNKVDENVIKSIEERWGLFLARLEFKEGFQPETIKSQYASFISQIKGDESDIQSHCYHTKTGNKLLGEQKYNEAIAQFNKAIEKDKNFAYTAHYNKAYAIIQNKGNEQDAKAELEQAKNIIDDILLPQLQAMGAVAQLCANAFSNQSGNTNERPASELELQVNSKMGLLNIHKKCIEDAIKTITEKKSENTIVVDTETSFEDMYENDVPTREIMELRGNGFRSLFTIKEKPPTNWWGIIGVAILGALQVVAGAALTACGIVNVGAALIGEGIGDLITATRSAISGEFSWGEYLKDKAISLAISVVTMGASAIKSAVKAAGSIAGAVKQSIKQAGTALKNVAGKVAGKGAQKTATTGAAKELAKDGWKIAGKKFLAEGLEQGLTELANYGVGLLTGQILNEFESDIRAKVKEKLSSIDKVKLNEILSDENNSEQILRSAEEFFDEKSNELLEAGKQILTGIANAKKGKKAFKVLSNIMQIAEVTTGITMAMSHTSNFCEHITREMNSINTNKKDQNDQNNLDITQADKLIDQWSKYVTDGIIATIHGRIISPLSNKAVSKGVGKVSNWAQRHLSSQGHNFDDKAYLWQQRRRVHKDAEHIANGNSEQHAQIQSSNKPQRPNTSALRNRSDLIHPNIEGGMLDVAALAGHLNRPVEIYKDGKLYHAVGRNNNGGDTIRLDYTPPSDGKPGHWEPHSTRAKQSGNNNCLFDAMTHELNKSKDGTHEANRHKLTPDNLRDIADQARMNKDDQRMQKAQGAEGVLLERDRKARERLGIGGAPDHVHLVYGYAPDRVNLLINHPDMITIDEFNKNQMHQNWPHTVSFVQDSNNWNLHLRQSNRFNHKPINSKPNTNKADTSANNGLLGINWNNPGPRANQGQVRRRCKEGILWGLRRGDRSRVTFVLDNQNRRGTPVYREFHKDNERWFTHPSFGNGRRITTSEFHSLAKNKNLVIHNLFNGRLRLHENNRDLSPIEALERINTYRRINGLGEIPFGSDDIV